MVLNFLFLARQYLNKFHHLILLFWIDSLNRNDQDFFDQFLEFHKIKIDRQDRSALSKYHKNWYETWIDYLKNFSNVEFINHEQTFDLNNNLSLFNYLNSKYPIISKGKMKLPKNIRRSNSFNINNYKKNTNFDEYSKFFKII